MKASDMAQKTDKELDSLVKDSRTALADLIVASRTKESKNVKSILAARKQLARALTIRRQRQLGAEDQS